MSRGIWHATLRWFLLIWVSSLVFAVLLIAPSVFMVRNISADVRAGVEQNRFVDAVQAAARMTLPSNTCRIALLLPAPATLQLVPGIATVLHASELICEVGTDIGAVSKLASVRAVAEQLAGSSLQELRVDEALLATAVTAAMEAEPLLHNALDTVQELNTIGLPGAAGLRIGEVAAAWPPQRIKEAHTLLGVADKLLGFDRPRTYFVALQSEAEMRATGGFLGQYAIVRIANGVPSILDVGINSLLRTPDKAGVKLLPNTDQLTLTDNPMPANSNLSPHGPDVGAIWLNMWKQQSGQQLDGAIALDVETAARLVVAAERSLKKPDGTQLRTAEDISAYAQNGVYFDFDGPAQSGDPRKAYQLEVFRSLLLQAASSVFSINSIVGVLPQSISEGRVLLYFNRPALQRQIETSAVAKDLRQRPELLFVTWNNWAGNKFDYFIEPTGTLRCVPDGMELRMQVIANADPKLQYPAYIKQRLDTPSETRPSVRNQWLLVMPRGSNVRWLSVDDRVSGYEVIDLGGRPVVQLILDTVAGERHEVRVGLGGLSNADLQIIGTAPVTTSC